MKAYQVPAQYQCLRAANNRVNTVICLQCNAITLQSLQNIKTEGLSFVLRGKEHPLESTFKFALPLLIVTMTINM